MPKNNAPLFPLLTCVVFSVAAHAQSFEYQDWAGVCDNTRHCEVLGFQHDDGDPPVTLWLARDAGPGTHLQARLMVQVQGDAADPSPDTIVVGRLKLRDFFEEGDLVAERALLRLLPALIEASTVQVFAGKQKWVLSLAGLKAALLKMDALQGRVGTRGALVAKGDKPESGPDSAVLPPLPVPRLVAKAVPPTSDQDGLLLARILKEIRKQAPDCWDNVPDRAPPEASIGRISATQVLVIRECSRGTPSHYHGVWLASSKPPYAPKRLVLPYPWGQSEEIIPNASFDDGVLSAVDIQRAELTCMGRTDWVWTDKGFALSASLSQPLCRGFTEGGYSLRAWVTTVQPPRKAGPP